mgnify:CR=1 FL=1|tara:strand:- start:1078 stop:2547 length:1470 start_codon:yes stop_codon:yes gene_type:complete
MKMLIYGIDGGDLEIMKTFDMPFVHQFLKENENVDLTVDLYNRGWVEILTGKEGKDTRGFYMSPVLDGSHRCATKFSMKELENDPDIVPLWQLAEQKGVKYCIMNVPTTTPVPQTKNGIVVGSAGGGLNKVDGIPEILVSDEKTREYLESKNYIVDIRIPNEDIDETEELFRQLKIMEDIRTDCFVEICKEERVEFGFLANRGTTIAEYLARSEIESYAALKEMDEFMPNGGEKSWVHEHLEEHFSALDNNIRKLYEELKPEHFIITADHNMVPNKYKANLSPFLLKNGWLVYKSSSSLLSSVKRFVKKFFKGESIGKVTSKLAPTVRESLKPYDWKKSVAFGHTFVSGIFINDYERFGGPVRSDKEIKRIVDDICTRFNESVEARELGLAAVCYRAKYHGAKFEKYLPDIVINGAEGIFFDERATKIITRNVNYGAVPKDLKLVTHAAYTGDKGVNPVCIVNRELLDRVIPEDYKNLTLVYRLVERVL